MPEVGTVRMDPIAGQESQISVVSASLLISVQVLSCKSLEEAVVENSWTTCCSSAEADLVWCSPHPKRMLYL